MDMLFKEEEMTIEDLAECIEMEQHNGAILFKIIQCFPGKNEIVNLVQLLTVEDENEIILINDIDNVISSNHLAISAFVKSQIVKIIKFYNEEKELNRYKLVLKNCDIQINPIYE